MMDVEPNDLLLFARIVEAGSFSRAAQRAGLPKSTVSRRIALLEARLGERLLQRTTRKLLLTEFGASLLEHARKVADEVEAAGALAQHRQLAPSGRLRISMPADFANMGLTGVMAQFMQRFPAVSLELDLSPRRVDLVSENFDIAIRMGDLPDDASLSARRVAFERFGLYAAPSYIAQRGLPEHPDELVKHDLLCILSRSGGAMPWVLTRGKTRWERELPARLTANSPDLLARIACSGAGIAASSSQFAEAHLQKGELVRVLPEWDLPTATAWAVFPGRRLMPAKTRAFLDMMEEMSCENARKAGLAPAA
jgi:DNA-binding transcriptional LysR family regulator